MNYTSMLDELVKISGRVINFPQSLATKARLANKRVQKLSRSTDARDAFKTGLIGGALGGGAVGIGLGGTVARLNKRGKREKEKKAVTA